MADAYIPDRGHLVWLNFDPQAGHEQAGHRPALVLSPQVYNRHGQFICVPLTTRIKGNPFEVAISGGERPAVALTDQVKHFDWRARGAEFIRRVDSAELGRVRTLARSLI